MNNQKNPESTKILKELSFCVFDLETTGGNHKSDKIIEIGLVKVEGLEIVDTKSFLIQPEIKIPEFIQKLTAITPKDVENSPKIEEVLDEILEFMGDSILVAHNTSFDVPFFNSVLRRLSRPELENPSLCTNLMTKYLIPNLMNSNLNYMSKIFEIHHQKAHRALDDAKATADLLLVYLGIFIHKNIQKINHLYYPRNRYELDRAHFKIDDAIEKEVEQKSDALIKRLKSIHSPFLITLKGDNGIILFALPATNNPDALEFIKEKLDTLPWKTTTIRLFGPFIEALVHYSNLFNKIDPQLRQEIIKFLWTANLPGKKIPIRGPHQTDNDGPPALDKNFGHFLIANHLVPEQMVIFPIASMHQKSLLIFRYPSHKKKLLQYINSKVSRISSNKLKPVHFNPYLKDFIDNYLIHEKETGNSIFIFDKKFPTKKPDEFLGQLDKFLAQNSNPYNYPKDYI
ncbi:MAG: 3'-5' exonuclease [Halobacteriovoraceae bacterium]|jgi:DNA polymerase III subunit epsilon|nr:3'-5' exonuclease [Halobacteriovoraceae bacterium]